MRSLPDKWTARFDAVVNLFTSFGFFAEPSDDVRVISEFARVLRPRGVLVWHGASRDGVSARFLKRDWWRTSDGTLVGQEREFDSLSGVLHVDTEWQGPSGGGHMAHRIRLYTATRLAELCRDAGLIVEAAGSLLGAVGVSGAPGGDADEACGRAGIDAIRDKLDF